MPRKYLGGSGDALTVFISIAASTVLVFYGYDQGVFGNAFVGQDFLDTVGNPTTAVQGTMTSVYNLGCFFGALSTIYTGDKLGRPRVLLVGSTVIALGGINQAASYGVPQMMVGRIVAGLGTGMNTTTAGVWQAETSKMRSRGKLVIIQMANCIIGFSISNWLTLGFSFAKGSVAWRFPLAFQVFFTAIIWCLCPFLPDSPRLLIRKGKYEEAYDVLAAHEGHGATVDSPSVKTQFNIIKDVLDREHMNTYTWRQLLTGKRPSDISGINVTSYYMTYVFIHALGITELRARIFAAAGSVDYLIFAILAYFVIERYGRRNVKMVSAAACCTCWVIITIVLALTESYPSHSFQYGAVAVTFFFVFFASFGMGVLGVPWLYPTETNALEMRTKGASLAMATNWIMNYMVAEVTPSGIANLSWRFWVILAVLCFSFVPITYFFYPETANRSQEDIDRFFENKPGIFIQRNKIATQLQRPAIYEEEDRRIEIMGEKNVEVSGSEVVEERVEHRGVKSGRTSG